ncbi:MAG: flavodoxin-dependent (E)-4-hydroxy-3-methylbut-2-enyl-diphosphate synthase [Abditibacteriota bacterium]|nr:flavodoxin-dependent (E)-4-hydroxy-3-methylbut-2-enyl-diphosphate synthase [Abditibacteriota bacterium]
MTRKNTRAVMAGRVQIGGGAPVSVQSMTNTRTTDIDATVAQIAGLEAAGCDIVRCAVPDMEAAAAIGEIKRQTGIPLVADVHFDWRLAVECVKQGVDKLRINPGNIGDRSRTEAVVRAAAERGIPIRIGVNAGSVDRKKYPELTARALVESGMEQVRILEGLGFFDTVLSFKASSVLLTAEAYRLAAEICDYPLHTGVTEAGLPRTGIIRSAIGIGSLLMDGIGDTIRVSLTSRPENEVTAGIEILRSLGLRDSGYTLISCPTCGRTRIALEELAQKVADYLDRERPARPVTVAVMGCVVNGPGEAREADLGIAGGDGKCALFARGELLRTVAEDKVFDEFVKELRKIAY